MPRRPNIHTAESLLANTQQEGGCRVWRGLRNRGGYGIVRANGNQRLVHRLVYELVKGPIPDGLQVCHSCDNRPCAEPEHLFAGTALDNSDDKISKGRAVQPHGEQHGMARLTAEQVAAARARFIPHDREHGASALARELGVHTATMQAVVTGKTWKDVVAQV